MTDAHETFEYTLTSADQAAFLLRTTRQPRRLAFQAAVFAVIWVTFLIIQIAVGLIAALFLARSGAADAARSYLTQTLMTDLTSSVPIFTAFVAFLAVLNFLVLLPRQCRLIATRLMNAYPAEPGHEGPRTLRIRMHVSERGIESRSADERGFVAWPLVRSFSETKRRFFLMTSRSHGLVIPKTSLDDATMERLRAAIGSRLVKAKAPLGTAPLGTAP